MDNASSSEDEDSIEFMFDPESFERDRQEEDEAPPKKPTHANMWVSWPDEAYADETTPITPFGLDNEDDDDDDEPKFPFELDSRDASLAKDSSGAAQIIHRATTPENSVSVEPGFSVPPKTLPMDAVHKAIAHDVSPSSPPSPSKDHKKRTGFLGGIFRKKK